MKLLVKLYLAFLKIGTFSFGGGYAMLPFIQKEIVEKNNWISSTEFTDIIGISQMTPGPVAINSATFVGYKISGVIGSIVDIRSNNYFIYFSSNNWRYVHLFCSK